MKRNTVVIIRITNIAISNETNPIKDVKVATVDVLKDKYKSAG